MYSHHHISAEFVLDKLGTCPAVQMTAAPRRGLGFAPSLLKRKSDTDCGWNRCAECHKQEHQKQKIGLFSLKYETLSRHSTFQMDVCCDSPVVLFRQLHYIFLSCPVSSDGNGLLMVTPDFCFLLHIQRFPLNSNRPLFKTAQLKQTSWNIFCPHNAKMKSSTIVACQSKRTKLAVVKIVLVIWLKGKDTGDLCSPFQSKKIDLRNKS